MKYKKDKLKDDLFKSVREEVKRASEHYYYTPQQIGIDNRCKRFVIERCEPYIKGSKVLDLGYVDGLWTDVILSKGCSVDIVEGAVRNVEHAKEHYSDNSRVRIFHQLFQEFEPDCQYDTVIAGDMLRYLADPLLFLKSIHKWIQDDGCLIVTVPNSRSFHRRIGALMNIERVPTEANQRDREVGNLRSYDRYEFRSLLIDADFKINILQGCFLKPLSSSQMENWSDELLRAFFDMGNELEDYCWFIYAVCSKPIT
jgi:2-polyprenyl-3-methyl-5-hydroxy-6-metoxy-1,4-benzoquinol methylase